MQDSMVFKVPGIMVGTTVPGTAEEGIGLGDQDLEWWGWWTQAWPGLTPVHSAPYGLDPSPGQVLCTEVSLLP